jgi:3-oxoacyl-[acyl-carrier protein] reductase
VGDIDILINNAGISSFKKFIDTKPEVFENIININLRGPFLCIQSVLPGMLKKNSGIIINIISVSAIKTFTKSSAYAASKAGLLAMSRSLREEVRKYGIKIIDIFPGATETEIWSKDSRDKFRDKMMKTEDVAEAVFEVIKLSMNNRMHVEEIVFRPQEGDL